MQAVNDKLSLLAILSMAVWQKKNRQARLAIFCAEKCKISETRAVTGVRSVSQSPYKRTGKVVKFK